MRLAVDYLLGSLLAAVAAVAIASSAEAQAAKLPSPASAASATVPANAASQPVPSRNAVVRASENAKEPGNQRPEERVVPQISIPLKSRNIAPTPAIPASAPGNVPGGVDDGAARCMASRNAGEKAACERGLAASGPVKPAR